MAALLAALVAVAGCGSSSHSGTGGTGGAAGTPGTGGAAGTVSTGTGGSATGGDGGSTVTDAGSGTGGHHDAGVDAPRTCAMTLSAACETKADGGSFGLHCASTWSSTTATAYFCKRPQTTVIIETCGDEHELIDTNGNVEYVYVYDSSGALVAVTYHGGDGGVTCLGGSSTFVEPVGCGGTALFTCPADGGHG
jgi:hypothetical protein